MIFLKRKKKDQNYCRFGKIIPFKEQELNNIEIEVEINKNGKIEIEKKKYTPLKGFFQESPLSEEKILNALKQDDAVIIETSNDREARVEREKKEREQSTIEKLEKKTKQDDQIRAAKKKIDELNEEKEEALKTKTKKDDIIVEKKLKKAEKKLKDAKNG